MAGFSKAERRRHHKNTRGLRRLVGYFSRKYPAFPHGVCLDVAGKIEERCGLRQVNGLFEVDKSNGGTHGKWRSHCWNITKYGSIVDLTAAQFNDYLDAPVQEEILIIAKDNPMYKRYTPYAEIFAEICVAEGLNL